MQNGKAFVGFTCKLNYTEAQCQELADDKTVSYDFCEQDLTSYDGYYCDYMDEEQYCKCIGPETASSASSLTMARMGSAASRRAMNAASQAGIPPFISA